MLYIVISEGVEINKIEIDQAQVESFTQATGWELVPGEAEEGE